MISHENALKSAKQEIERIISKYNKTDLKFSRKEFDEMTVLSWLYFCFELNVNVD